jgi:hypothetical protein
LLRAAVGRIWYKGTEGISVSDNYFGSDLVINGAIRDEIGLNYEMGAMGLFAHAKTTSGKAWNLLSINGGNCGKVGTNSMGTAISPMNLIKIRLKKESHEIQRSCESRGCLFISNRRHADRGQL